MLKTKSTIALLTGCLVAAAPLAKAADVSTNKIWESSIALGLTLAKGNSDTLLFTGNWLSQAKWDKNELRLGADGAYGEDSGETSNEYFGAFAQYNRLFTERFYGYFRVNGSHDGIADIDYRFVVSPGAGYYFIKTPKTTLSGEIGPGWVYEKKGGETDDYFTLRLAERFEHKFSDRVRLWESVEYLPDVGNWGNYILNAELGIESALSKALSLRVFVTDTYQSEPAEGRKENDVKLVAAIAYKF